MKTILEEFGNEKCVILKLLYDNQIKVKDDCYVSLSQQEMADMVHYSKVKTNKIINDLKRIGCISTFDNQKGKYFLTQKAEYLIKLLSEEV